ncbi:MAG TPA: hypothetical protein VEO19_10345 [Terriglobia bacterium]|nr:hypothetical protein [Terriglobia bacterium]
MTPSILFLIGLAVSLVTFLAVVVYLKPALHRILVELCGTSERATFWAAFTNISVVLVPLIFALQYTPELKEGQSAVLEIAAQLKWALAGLLATVVMVGWILSRFMRQWPPANTPQSTGEAH